MEESKISSLTSCCSHPLFSCIVTFCTLVLLYLPHLFWKIILSPVLILTGIILLTILRLGAVQRSQDDEQKEKNPVVSEPIISEENRGSKEGMEMNSTEPEDANSFEQVHQWISSHFKIESDMERNFRSNSCFEESFTEWNVKAPLEVIHEEYEGEQEANDDPNVEMDTRVVGILRYPSLSRYNPESGSDSSSDGGFPPKGNWDSPENICFKWDEEDTDGLIEIALEGCCKKRGLELQFEEENMIEIDLFPMRYKDFSGDNEHFSGEISCGS